MPILNGRGDVLAGAGGVQGSLNGVPFPFATFGGGVWLDDVTVLLMIPAPPPTDGLLATWHPGEAQPAVLPEHRGANDFAAGGGRYFAWLAGYGGFGSLGHLPAAGCAGPHSVAPDGTIGYIPDRGNGYGLELVDADGLAHEIPGIWARAEQTIGAGAAIWTGGAFGTPAPRPAVTDAQGIIVADLADGRWLVYWSDVVGFVAQLDGATDGYVLGVTPTFFNHHARNVGGELVIAWSLTQGEAAADVRTMLIDRTAPRGALVAAPPHPDPGPVPPQPQPIPPHPTPGPVPPRPTSPFYIRKGSQIMDAKVVAIKGPAGKYGRPDEPNTGPWAGENKGWRGVVWDGDSVEDERYRWNFTKPDTRFAFSPVTCGGWLGVDATKHSGDIGSQFYVTPNGGSRGEYEALFVYEGNALVPLVAEAEYSNDQGKYPSCAFAVEIQS